MRATAGGGGVNFFLHLMPRKTRAHPAMSVPRGVTMPPHPDSGLVAREKKRERERER